MQTRSRNRCLRKTIVTNPDRLKLERADPLRSIRCVHGALQYTRLRRDGPLASVRVVQREFRVLRVQIVDAVASVTSSRQHNRLRLQWLQCHGRYSAEAIEHAQRVSPGSMRAAICRALHRNDAATCEHW